MKHIKYCTDRDVSYESRDSIFKCKVTGALKSNDAYTLCLVFSLVLHHVQASILITGALFPALHVSCASLLLLLCHVI